MYFRLTGYPTTHGETQSHREEARFVESLSELPVLGDIRIEIETNISLLEKLSSEEIWKQAPSSVRDPSPSDGGKPKKSRSKKKQSSEKKPNHIEVTDENIVFPSDDSTFTSGMIYIKNQL